MEEVRLSWLEHAAASFLCVRRHQSPLSDCGLPVSMVFPLPVVEPRCTADQALPEAALAWLGAALVVLSTGYGPVPAGLPSSTLTPVRNSQCLHSWTLPCHVLCAALPFPNSAMGENLGYAKW